MNRALHCLTVIALLLCAPAAVRAEPVDYNIASSTVDGRLTGTVTVRVAPEWSGRQGVMVVALQYSTWWFVLDANAAWSPWTEGPLPATVTGALNDQTFQVARDFDIKALRPADITLYVGYGASVAEMQSSGRHARAMRLRCSDVDCPQPFTTPPQAREIGIVVRWAVPRFDCGGILSTGCEEFLPDGRHLLTMPLPSSWSDTINMERAGHELMHALGASHP